MDTREEISALYKRAKQAMDVAEGFSQRRVDELAAAIIYKLADEELAREIAELALEETQMGNIQSKINKLVLKMPAVFYQIKGVKTVGVVEEQPELGIVKIAKPLGVIAALVPSTNPEATPVFKGTLALRGRNAVIFAPHPKSKKTTLKVVKIMREILRKNGAPEDLFICIEEPSKEKSQLLMQTCDITMATGSGDMVRAAYSSGKPAYGVGAGNAPIVVDETANLADAAEKIKIGKTGDNASGCSAENSLVIQNGIYDEMVSRLKEQGGYLATAEDKQKLQAAMWVNGYLSGEIVAKPAVHIAKVAGISVPEDTAFIMVEETGVGKNYPFSGEKISLVLTLFRYETFDEAIAKVNAITAYSGYGHSCGIHSNDDDHILRLALNTKTTRVLVRQPHGAGNSGNWFNGLANTFSLGCGTWGGNIVSENITQKHYINTTWLSRPIDRKPVPKEEIFAGYLDNVIM